jgi:hypothetical protein
LFLSIPRSGKGRSGDNKEPDSGDFYRNLAGKELGEQAAAAISAAFGAESAPSEVEQAKSLAATDLTNVEGSDSLN